MYVPVLVSVRLVLMLVGTRTSLYFYECCRACDIIDISIPVCGSSKIKTVMKTLDDTQFSRQ